MCQPPNVGNSECCIKHLNLISHVYAQCPVTKIPFPVADPIIFSNLHTDISKQKTLKMKNRVNTLFFTLHL